MLTKLTIFITLWAPHISGISWSMFYCTVLSSALYACHTLYEKKNPGKAKSIDATQYRIPSFRFPYLKSYIKPMTKRITPAKLRKNAMQIGFFGTSFYYINSLKVSLAMGG